jgi:acetate kinase
MQYLLKKYTNNIIRRNSMLTWKDYEYERERRQDKIAQAKHYRMVQSATDNCESNVTKLSIRMLDEVGTQLVQWGSQLQCRCAEMAISASKRAI